MKQFEIIMECRVKKCVTCECDLQEEAEENPWDHCVDEQELEQIDWEIESIKEV